MLARQSICIKWLIVSLLITAITSAVVVAQEQVYLHEVEPGDGRPGQELELILHGGGFGGANEVWVTVGELQVLDAWIDSDQTVSARILIPEGAQPGPRDVTVTVSFGQNEEFSASLPGGFSVQAASGRDDGGEGQPGNGGFGWVWWLIIPAAVVGLAIVTLAAALTLRLRKRPQKPELQQQAQTESQSQEQQKPSEECQAGAQKTVREELDIEPGRWRVSGLKVTLYDSASGERGATREAPSDLVGRIDKAARDRLLRGDSDALAQEATRIGRELAALIVAWQSLSETRLDVQLEPQIEGGEASAKFVRYRCVGKPGRWQKESEWEAKITAVDHFPATFHGPAPGQDQRDYQARLERELGDYVRGLIGEAGRLF